MFRGVFSAAERVGAGPAVRLTSRVLTFASRFWQIESLYRSNARYLPRWVPRYLCYDSSLTLTRVALAAGVAEGFLPAIGGHQERSYDGRVVFEGRPVPFAEAVAAQQRSVREAVRPVRRLSQQQRVRHQGHQCRRRQPAVPAQQAVAAFNTGRSGQIPAGALMPHTGR